MLAVLAGFYYPPDRDLLFAHVQTSAGPSFLFYDHLCGVAMAPSPLAPKSNPVQSVEIPAVGWIIPVSQSNSQMLS